MKNKFAAAMILVLALCFTFQVKLSFAELATVTGSWTSSDVNEFQNYSPSAKKTFAGERLKGLFQKGAAVEGICTSDVISCNTVATTRTNKAVIKTTGAAWGESEALADGMDNQTVTYVLATDGGKDLYVTPTTKSGFTSVQLSDAGDSVSLLWSDSTSGWVISGNAGTTINQ